MFSFNQHKKRLILYVGLKSDSVSETESVKYRLSVRSNQTDANDIILSDSVPVNSRHEFNKTFECLHNVFLSPRCTNSKKRDTQLLVHKHMRMETMRTRQYN